ncbi:MAG: antibiotic biosynthesis monooxygenase [Mycobacterium sp.]|jgi:quinol monooxygenase YgiN|nr:antibiotic biosynthesis monooxygenase [Mycobacterium sp.]MDT5232419.1 hypothetical protein [Mycobacterium sp.]
MIFIVVKFETKPEWTDRWPELVAPFTAGTSAEEGNLWFDWSRNLEHPAKYVLVEAFGDADAGAAHVNSDTSRRRDTTCRRRFRRHRRSSARTSTQTGWSRLAEISVD